MYEIFLMLLNERGLKTSDVAKATGLNQTFFSDWKSGKSKRPNVINLQKVADFFGVSVDYLMTGKEPTVENAFGAEYAELVGKIRNDAELSKALLKYFDLPKEEKEHVIDLINILGNRSVK